MPGCLPAVYVDLGWLGPVRRGCRQPSLTPDEIAALKARITTLETQLDQIMMGMQVRVTVDQNGERLEFSGVNINTLKAYIESLKARLPGYCPTVARPIGFLF